MHEALITIKKVWPVFKPGDKRTTIEDSEDRKWRIEVGGAVGILEGEPYRISYTEESFNNKSYNLIKNIKPADGGPPPKAVANGHAPNGNGGGPEKGMVVKESVALLAAGHSAKQILSWFRTAEEIYRQLKSPEAFAGPTAPRNPAPEFDDQVTDIGETF